MRSCVTLSVPEPHTCRPPEFDILRLQKGQPSIFERFLANVYASGFAPMVLPLRTTSIVGMRVLQHLVPERRLAHLPQAIYVDSAHEVGETIQEIWMAWQTLPARGGILFGDDMQWENVMHDVTTFVSCVGGSPAGRGFAAEFGDLLGLPLLSSGACASYGSPSHFLALPTAKFGTGCYVSTRSGHYLWVYQNQWVIIRAAGETLLPEKKEGCAGLVPSTTASKAQWNDAARMSKAHVSGAVLPKNFKLAPLAPMATEDESAPTDQSVRRGEQAQRATQDMSRVAATQAATLRWRGFHTIGG